MCLFIMRQYACGHADVGERLRHCDFRRMRNRECNRFALAPEEITIETGQCAACREGDTFVGVRDQDSAHSDAVSPPILGFERRERSWMEQNSKPLAPLIGECDVPYEGPTLFYKDGTTRTKAWINAQWSVREALYPRKLLGIACPHCQRRKIRCDLAEPRCGNCSRLGRDCWLPITGPRNLDDGSLKLTEEVQSVTKAGAPRKRSGIACTACKEKEIVCDPAEPKCVQCAKHGRDCRWTTSGPRNLIDEALKHPEEVQSVTKAGTPRTNLAIQCGPWREKKIKCDPAEPNCVQCARVERRCYWPTSSPGNPGVETLKCLEEVQKPKYAPMLNFKPSFNNEDSRCPSPMVPSASPKTSKTTTLSTRPVPILAHNLALGPQSREYMPEGVPQQAEHSRSTDGSLSAAILQADVCSDDWVVVDLATTPMGTPGLDDEVQCGVRFTLSREG